MNPVLDNLSHVDRWWLLLHYAVMAPSGHNSQPWLFRINGSVVSLYQDRSRWLPIVDPHGRELTMSCGAALLNLRIAIAHFGLAETTELLPDENDPDLLARVTLVNTGRIDPPETTLFDAIPRRRTNRFPFDPAPVSDETISRIEIAAKSEGAWVVLVRAAADRKRIANLIAEGDRVQASDPDLKKEIARWVRTNASPRRDGLRGYSFGHGRFASLIAPLYVKYAELGRCASRGR